MIKRASIVVAWTAGLLCCIAILRVVHDLKWPASGDRYHDIARAAKIIQPMISGDSVLSLCASDVPEELIVYLRYCLIPVRVQLLPRLATGKALLIASRSSIAQASDKLRASRPASAVLWRFEDAVTAFELLQF